MGMVSPVHPRARGERPCVRTCRSCACGSSPRARGTARRGRGATPRSRFIPARAGNGNRTARSPCTTAVHPRARGERNLTAIRNRTTGGSSPRARGTESRGEPQPEDRRFIPARAGNGAPLSRIRAARPVHPRARGERGDSLEGMWSGIGSSPRARGTAENVGFYCSITRFIPARAGNGTPRAWAAQPSPVHPRARGERVYAVGARSPNAGSSPRARGTDGGRRHCLAAWRFIPARAGNGG